MTSTKQIGNQSVQRVVKYLSDLGWVVQEVESKSPYALVKDLFGLFDLVAIRPDGRVEFIQVTTNHNKRASWWKRADDFSLKTYFYDWSVAIVRDDSIEFIDSNRSVCKLKFRKTEED